MMRTTWIALAALLCLAVTAPHGNAQAIPHDAVTTVFVTDTIADFGAVGGVATDRAGYVYIADFRNTIWRLQADGTLIKFADGFYGASGIAVGPRGHIYQSNFFGDFVARVSRTGHWERLADEGLSGPVGLTVAPSGEIYVVNCNSNSVARIDQDGTVTELAGGALFNCPNGITLDDRGDLYVVNFNNTKIVKVTPAGVATEFVDVPGGFGNGHITFTRGAFYITKHRANQIWRVTRDGSYSLLAGTGQPGETDGPALEATFTFPNGIAADPVGEYLWVNDRTEGVGLARGVSVVTMRRIKLVSLADILNMLDPQAGAVAVRQAYEAYRESRAQENTSGVAISQGYAWLTAGRIAQAVAVFELNGESYPDDANSQYHLGEAYRYSGQTDRAAEQYRKVLEMQPDHAQARSRLAEVGG